MSEFLTQQEVGGLPDGTRVVIIWSGGNGPHEYTVKQTLAGPAAISDNQGSLPDTYNLITFVGAERFHTRVSRALQEVEGG